MAKRTYVVKGSAAFGIFAAAILLIYFSLLPPKSTETNLAASAPAPQEEIGTAHSVHQVAADKHLQAADGGSGDFAKSVLVEPAPTPASEEDDSDVESIIALAQRVKARRTMLWYYGPYLSQAKLPSEIVDRLEELLTQEMETPALVNESLRALQKDRDPVAGPHALLSLLAENQTEVRKLLGDAEYTIMGEMARTVRFTDAIDAELQPSLYGTGRPLSETQSGALARRLAAFANDDNPAFRAALQQPPDANSGLTQIDLAYLRIATEILDVQQLDVMRASLQAKRVVERQKNEDLQKGPGSYSIYKFDL